MRLDRGEHLGLFERFLHGLDLMPGRWELVRSPMPPHPEVEQALAYDYLVGRVAKDCADAHVRLLIVHWPEPDSPPESLRAAAARYHVPILDLTSVAARNKTLRQIDGHPSAQGHALIAAAIVDRIRPKDCWRRSRKKTVKAQNRT